MRVALAFACTAILAVLSGGSVAAQEPDSTEAASPAFALSTSEAFTTRERPHVNLTFRQLSHLDFRVYRVRDPFAFFAALRDPHQIGSDEPVVPRERSWIERLTAWKGAQRRAIRGFVRDQVSRAYRAQRHDARERQQVAQRVMLDHATFAQVPLLNPDQLVTSWRELLPNPRDPEYRRVPLDANTPGVYLVEAVSGSLRAYTIVMVSDVGLVAKTAPGGLLLFAADRFSGEPQANCEVQVLADQRAIATGRTAADGVFTLRLPETTADHLVGVARCGDQVAATAPGRWFFGEAPRQLVGYVYTDKPIYRPGHTVHVKAVLRWREHDALLPFDAEAAEIAVRDLNDKVLFRQPVRPDAFGAVHASFTLPDGATLGFHQIRIASGEFETSGGFEVQEYRRPEFEVIVSPAARFVVQGQEAVAAVQARYYFGQPVANARVRYVVNQQPYDSPLRWTESGEGENGSTYWYGDDQRLEGEIRLDAEGRGEIRVPLAIDEQGRDYSARIEAQVADASHREVSGNTIVHATHGPFLVTVETGQSIVRASQPVSATVRTLGYTGTPQGGVRVAVVLTRVIYTDGYYAEPQRIEVGRSEAVTDAEGRATASLHAPAAGGSYRIQAVAREGGRELRGETWLWVAGAQDGDVPDGDRYLELLADKRTYGPGDVARLVLRGEPVAGPMLVTKEGQHVMWHQVIRPSEGAALDVPIVESDVGDVYVNVTFMRDGRLHRAERRLAVPAIARTLHIRLTPEAAVARPQQPGVFSVLVTDVAGAPVHAQVSLGVVDEAVYAVRQDDTPDPVRFFHRREYSRVGTTFSRDYYFTGFSGPERLHLTSRRRRPFTLADFKGDRPAQPQVRREFPDAIYWIGDLVTDAQGRARVALRYPDALTTWRLTARAVTRDTKAGAAVARTTTTKDLIVRVITPRFLTQGDRVVLPAITHNYLPNPQDATVAMSASGLEPADPEPHAPRLGLVESGGERRDDWTFRASQVGTAVVTATALTAAESDAVELPIPVQPYGLRREPGAAGVLFGDGEDATEIVVPASSNPAARSLTVSLAPSVAGSLLGALDFLTSFPYGCTEQTLSSFLPNLFVSRTMAQLGLPPTERLALLDRQVAAGLRRLGEYQKDDGGWGWWRTDANHPFMTAYAVFGLLEAQRAGYRVEEYRLDLGARALARMHATYADAEPDLRAYLVYVLLRASAEDRIVEGFSAPAALDDLWTARGRMSPYGRALLLQAMDLAADPRGDELARRLADEAQTRGELSWWTSERDPLLADLVDTSVEATAMAVQALARRDPASPLLDRAVRWLLLNRRGGYWWNTKQTAFALFGLTAVLQARGERADEFTVDVFVNGAPAGTHRFTRDAVVAPDPVSVAVPAREGANTIRLVKRGGGSLYWSARATYYDTAGADRRTGTRELAVARRYARLVPVRRQDRIVYREEPFDGRMNAGDVLSVRLTVAGAHDWRYLIVEDPLPAGVEAVQDTTAFPLESGGSWPGFGGSQTEFRDNRTVFFQERLDGGRADYVYLVRAISSGEFRAMPAQVMPMYVPGVSAASDAATVVVTPPSGAPR